MLRPGRIPVTVVNPHLLCVLCGGYFVDATTIIECLHSYCRTCIVRYLETSKMCPLCDVLVHKTKPLENLRADKTLQDLVYKLVPGLFDSEMENRRKFYEQHPEEVKEATVEDRGEAGMERDTDVVDENISLVLELSANGKPPGISTSKITDRRYLLCPSGVTVGHLKKFVRAKFNVPSKYQIQFYHTRLELSDNLSLLDISTLYTWRRAKPLCLFYMIYNSPARQQDISSPESKRRRLSALKARQEKKLASLLDFKSTETPINIGNTKLARQFQESELVLSDSDMCTVIRDVNENCVKRKDSDYDSDLEDSRHRSREYLKLTPNSKRAGIFIKPRTPPNGKHKLPKMAKLDIYCKSSKRSKYSDSCKLLNDNKIVDGMKLLKINKNDSDSVFTEVKCERKLDVFDFTDDFSVNPKPAHHQPEPIKISKIGDSFIRPGRDIKTTNIKPEVISSPTHDVQFNMYMPNNKLNDLILKNVTTPTKQDPEKRSICKPELSNPTDKSYVDPKKHKRSKHDVQRDSKLTKVKHNDFSEDMPHEKQQLTPSEKIKKDSVTKKSDTPISSSSKVDDRSEIFGHNKRKMVEHNLKPKPLSLSERTDKDHDSKLANNATDKKVHKSMSSPQFENVIHKQKESIQLPAPQDKSTDRITHPHTKKTVSHKTLNPVAKPSDKNCAPKEFKQKPEHPQTALSVSKVVGKSNCMLLSVKRADKGRVDKKSRKPVAFKSKSSAAVASGNQTVKPSCKTNDTSLTINTATQSITDVPQAKLSVASCQKQADTSPNTPVKETPRSNSLEDLQKQHTGSAPDNQIGWLNRKRSVSVTNEGKPPVEKKLDFKNWEYLKQKCSKIKTKSTSSVESKDNKQKTVEGENNHRPENTAIKTSQSSIVNDVLSKSNELNDKAVPKSNDINDNNDNNDDKMYSKTSTSKLKQLCDVIDELTNTKNDEKVNIVSSESNEDVDQQAVAKVKERDGKCASPSTFLDTIPSSKQISSENSINKAQQNISSGKDATIVPPGSDQTEQGQPAGKSKSLQEKQTTQCDVSTESTKKIDVKSNEVATKNNNVMKSDNVINETTLKNDVKINSENVITVKEPAKSVVESVKHKNCDVITTQSDVNKVATISRSNSFTINNIMKNSNDLDNFSVRTKKQKAIDVIVKQINQRNDLNAKQNNSKTKVEETQNPHEHVAQKETSPKTDVKMRTKKDEVRKIMNSYKDLGDASDSREGSDKCVLGTSEVDKQTSLVTSDTNDSETTNESKANPSALCDHNSLIFQSGFDTDPQSFKVDSKPSSDLSEVKLKKCVKKTMLYNK